MKKLKIRIIDEKKRVDDIYSAVKSYNLLSKEEALRSDEEVFENPELSPDIFLLHITDLKKQGKPSYDYLKRIDNELKDALIVLYSGGTLEIIEHSEKRIIFKLDDDTWNFEVSDGNRICILERPVNSLSDIPIKQALENYLDSDKDRDIFFKTLKYIGTEYITALVIFCQGYLMTGLAVGKIEDKEVETLIGWSDKIKEIFKKSKHDWEASWKKAKNPQWWFSKEQIKYLKEYAKTDVEKLIEYIEKGNDIEACNYKVVKEALIQLGKKK